MRAYLEERAERIRGRRHKKKQARAARVRRQVLRYLLLAVLLYCGTTGMIRVPWALPDPDEDVKVSGNQVVSSVQIKKVLKPCLHKPVYTLNPKELEARIKSLPGVHNAFVRRYLFPHPYIQVQIMEEFPWASVAAGPESAVCGVISETGRYIPVAEFPGIAQPSLRFFTAPCQKMSEGEVRTWANWVSFIAIQTGLPIEYVDLRKADDIRVQAGDLQLRLGAADSTLPKRLNRLSSIMPVLSTIKERVDYINLGLDSNIPLKVSKAPAKQDGPIDYSHYSGPPLPQIIQPVIAAAPVLSQSPASAAPGSARQANTTAGATTATAISSAPPASTPAPPAPSLTQRINTFFTNPAPLPSSGTQPTNSPTASTTPPSAGAATTRQAGGSSSSSSALRSSSQRTNNVPRSLATTSNSNRSRENTSLSSNSSRTTPTVSTPSIRQTHLTTRTGAQSSATVSRSTVPSETSATTGRTRPARAVTTTRSEQAAPVQNEAVSEPPVAPNIPTPPLAPPIVSPPSTYRPTLRAPIPVPSAPATVSPLPASAPSQPVLRGYQTPADATSNSGSGNAAVTTPPSAGASYGVSSSSRSSASSPRIGAARAASGTAGASANSVPTTYPPGGFTSTPITPTRSSAPTSRSNNSDAANGIMPAPGAQ